MSRRTGWLLAVAYFAGAIIGGVAGAFGWDTLHDFCVFVSGSSAGVLAWEWLR